MTNRQKKFVSEYLSDPEMNATAAYKRAGYKAKGNAAEVNAARLLRNAQVAAAVKQAMDKRAKRAEITAEWVLSKLLSESQFEGEGASHAARIKATELLGKHLGLFEDRLRVSQDGPVEIVIKRAAKKDADGNG